MFYKILFLNLFIFSSFALTPGKELIVDKIISKMDLNLTGNFAGYDGAKISEQVKTDLRTKLNTANYQEKDLTEILATLNDPTFSKVNKTISAEKFKLKDLLMKSPTEAFAKLTKDKQTTAKDIEEKLDFKKYSKLGVNQMGDDLIGNIPDGLPESMASAMKKEMKGQAEKGILASFYERVGTVDLKDLKTYQGFLDQKSFQKYYKDLMEIGLKNLKSTESKK